jgi:hypothetical protein
MKHFWKICSPALLFLIFAILAILVSFWQNFSFQASLTLGKTTSDLPMTSIVYILSAIFVVIWTILIDNLCKLGYAKLSWGCFLIPSILIVGIMILLIAMQGLSMTMKINEGFGMFFKIKNE